MSIAGSHLSRRAGTEGDCRGRTVVTASASLSLQCRIALNCFPLLSAVCVCIYVCVCFTCISVKLGADCVLCRISRLCNNRLSSVRLDWQRASSENKIYTRGHDLIQPYVSRNGHQIISPGFIAVPKA